MFISTDKACAPINVYGMCKAISERLYIDYAEQQKEIKVCLVRYGNVLESTGSVIPYFKKLLKEGISYLPITDMRMTRFLLTLDRACDLIDFAYNREDTHGCICIPKVKSFSIPSIARALIKWNNSQKPQTLKEVGVRPGEKLHEAMISEIEWMKTIDIGDNYLITNKIQTTESKSYNSLDALMPDEEVYDFLKESKVI
jgi:UDP-N-acetylglucosamine 4,6-dehydratase